MDDLEELTDSELLQVWLHDFGLNPDDPISDLVDALENEESEDETEE